MTESEPTRHFSRRIAPLASKSVIRFRAAEIGVKYQGLDFRLTSVAGEVVTKLLA